MTTAVTREYARIPYLIAFQNNSGVHDVHGGRAELTVLESYLRKPRSKPSDTVIVFMHPISGGAYLSLTGALARVCTPSHARRPIEAIGYPDKEMHEIPGATHYYAGSDQRDKPRQAVGVGRLVRHRLAGPQ